MLDLLKDNYVCGVKDITGEKYAGVSGSHLPSGKAAMTTNGAGPHNLQIFMLAPDGTVLHCLPGFWHAQDLARELDLAEALYQVWIDPRYTRSQKDALFRKMQIEHIAHHPPQMTRRSRMQGFDQKFEAKHRLASSDTIRNPELAKAVLAKGAKPQPGAFKTTDEIMHERMARRPFLPYNQFDVVAFSDYGRPFYNKNEDQRDESGEVIPELAKSQPLIGNTDAMKRGQRKSTAGRMMNGMARRSARMLMRQGIRAAIP